MYQASGRTTLHVGVVFTADALGFLPKENVLVNGFVTANESLEGGKGETVDYATVG